MEKLVRKLKEDHPDLVFSLGNYPCWSPVTGQISYSKSQNGNTFNIEGLLHELGHARLFHTIYLNDLDLLQKEVAAWEEAHRLAKQYGVKLNKDHIEDCLDSYRDWIYRRSICPGCAGTGLQVDKNRFACLNCDRSWHVTPARFRRPYRRLSPQ
jgi:hypothetical protein